MNRRRHSDYVTVRKAKKTRGSSSANSGRRKVFFTIGGLKDGSPAIREIVVNSSWNPGRSIPSKRYKKIKA